MDYRCGEKDWMGLCPDPDLSRPRGEDILDAAAGVYDAIAPRKSPFPSAVKGYDEGVYLSQSPQSSSIRA